MSLSRDIGMRYAMLGFSSFLPLPLPFFPLPPASIDKSRRVIIRLAREGVIKQLSAYLRDAKRGNLEKDEKKNDAATHFLQHRR